MATRVTRSSTKHAAPEVDDLITPPASKSPQKRQKTEPTPKHISKTNGDTTSSTSDKPTGRLQILEETGDIFDAPPNAVIIHACNCDGSWGGWIAKAFKQRYPKAFGEYVRICKEKGHALLDSGELIPPVDSPDFGRSNNEDSEDQEGLENDSSDDGETEEKTEGPSVHFVGCLFTSRRYGKKKDSPSRILVATRPAMEDLLKQIDEWNARVKESDRVQEVRMCKINSGLFAVPWEKSKTVLEDIDVSERDVKVIRVISPKN